ncbi:hypothetical protein TrLO_g6841 [Triparma laevis f. longispina]|uniref:CCR4-NOT transcription complex subunit 3 n=1 Tax=Triparma laevis f. longispina TaxID=1714387 RepID=A0A9W7FC48_9STRA|nr:hypothetical protein TrLO_g6841 [Triparma laevis f. longispina]
MSAGRKLQTEIDRVLKKVDEGVEIFDELHEKVYSAEQQAQKEKYESDLKKEIKKLQRLRDQIKTWINSIDVKDKSSLLSSRKLIESKMEIFKITEKDTKTKTYSKEGLARSMKLDPAEQKKADTNSWVLEMVEVLRQKCDEHDAEVEKLSSGKSGAKKNKKQIENWNSHVTNHKFHIDKLESIARLVMNDSLAAEPVDEIKDDLDFYLEAYADDPDFLESYDEEFYYENLGLEDLSTKPVAVKVEVKPVKDEKKKVAKVKAASSMGGLMTIGRAKVKDTSNSNDPVISGASTKTPTKSAPIPTKISTPPVVKPVASMAAMLKGGEEKAKLAAQQQAAAAAEQQRLAAQKAAAEQLRVKAAAEQQQKARAAQIEQERVKQQQLLMQQQQQRQQALQAAQQQAAQQQAQQQQAQQQAQQAQQAQQQQAQQQAQQAQQAAAAQQQQAQQAQQAAAAQQQQAQQQQQQQQWAQQQQQNNVQMQPQDLPIGNLNLDGGNGQNQMNVQPHQYPQQQQQSMPPPQQQHTPPQNLNSPTPPTQPQPPTPPQQPQQPQQPQKQVPQGTQTLSLDAAATYLSSLNESYGYITGKNDSERPKSYAPRNPYPTPSSYPSQPSTVFDNPAIFEKLGTDCLFFIFYYQQGTYQQYLAARELKKQSWRYHKKYMTWFQRHEEPNVTTEEYEQGTYVYFDYESGWCQRVKADFKFEYQFLEDSLL